MQNKKGATRKISLKQDPRSGCPSRVEQSKNPEHYSKPPGGNSNRWCEEKDKKTEI